MPRDYFMLIESFEPTTEKIRRAGPAEYARARDAMIEDATKHLLACRAEDFEKLMVWQTDKLYRLMNAVDIIDDASFVFLSAVGAAFDEAARERGRSMAYLVDNIVTPLERLRGIEAAFKALRFVVASPELFAVALGEHDGIAAELAIGERFSYYRDEAFMLARRLVVRAMDGRRHFMWISGEAGFDDLQVVTAGLVGRPYVGVFRNDAPVDGTEVQVFQSSAAR